MPARNARRVVDTTADTLPNEPVTALQAVHQFETALARDITRGLREEALNVRTLSIEDDAEEAEAAARLVEVRNLGRDLKELIDKAKRPFLDVTQRLDRMTKQGRDDIALLDAALFSCIESYRVKQAHKLEAARRSAQQQARSRDVPALTTSLNTMQASKPQALESVAIKLVWTAVVVDPDAVPRDWCVPDQKALDQHAAGAPGKAHTPPPPIAGVRFELKAKGRIGR